MSLDSGIKPWVANEMRATKIQAHLRAVITINDLRSYY